MRILYDGEVFRYQSFGGINRYFENIIPNLPASFEPTVLATSDSDLSKVTHANLKICRYGGERWPQLARWPNLQSFSYRLDAYLKQLPKHLAQIEMRSWDRMSRLRRFDLAHPTYYWPLTKGSLSNYRWPLVVTVWDMNYELVGPNYLDPTGERAQLKKEAILRADALICISENTKQDLMRLYSIPEDRITVTYLATHLNANMAAGPEPIPDRPYFLFVGTRHYHKNFRLLLEALAQAVSVERDIYLGVVSRPEFNDEEKKIISDLKLETHIGECGDVTDEHLAKLYQSSLGLVYPSLYEGFGLPPLEAMSCGGPVIVARSSSLPEVVGDAGLYFDPYSAEELADALVQLRRNDSLRAELIRKGFERAALFNWAKTAAETVEVYRSLAG